MDNLLQDITIYHKNGNSWDRYVERASVRNTFIKNRNETGSSNVNSALIRIFNVADYNNTYFIENGDVIVDKVVEDEILRAPLTELRDNYGKDSVYTVDTVEKFIFDGLDLSHIKVGAK